MNTIRIKKIKKAFTLIELVFVIVVIGILAGVAVPRLAATRDDAEITKGATMLSAVRNALSIERQKRILSGNFTPITGVGDATNVFNHFWTGTPSMETNILVLEYPEPSSSGKYHWSYIDASHTVFCLTKGCVLPEDTIKFQLINGRFNCIQPHANSGHCSILGITSDD